MSLNEKYWLTILLIFGRYLSIILLVGPVGFILAGYYFNWLWYLGLIGWPLTFMIGLTNFRYLSLLTKKYKLGWHQVMEDVNNG